MVIVILIFVCLSVPQSKLKLCVFVYIVVKRNFIIAVSNLKQPVCLANISGPKTVL